MKNEFGTGQLSSRCTTPASNECQKADKILTVSWSRNNNGRPSYVHVTMDDDMGDKSDMHPKQATKLN